MKKLTLIFMLLIVTALLSACSKPGGEKAHSIAVLNGDDHAVTVKLVDVNGSSYLRDAVTLQSGGQYLLAVTAGSSVKVKIMVQDYIYDKDLLFQEQFIDNADEGIVIQVEYNGGEFYSGTSVMGRLSTWGSAK